MLYWLSQMRICVNHTKLYNITNIRIAVQFHCILQLDVLIFYLYLSSSNANLSCCLIVYNGLEHGLGSVLSDQCISFL